jgi:hypothetical protein
MQTQKKEEAKMANYEVGYKKPPRHSQFKAGNRGNPQGRGKRKVPTEGETMKNVMNFPAEFRHRGKSKRAPRIELMIKSYGADALKGDVGAAAVLLKMRAHFEKHGDINPEKITIVRVMMRPGGKLWADAVAASRERGRLGPFTARR